MVKYTIRHQDWTCNLTRVVIQCSLGSAFPHIQRPIFDQIKYVRLAAPFNRRYIRGFVCTFRCQGLIALSTLNLFNLSKLWELLSSEPGRCRSRTRFSLVHLDVLSRAKPLSPARRTTRNFPRFQCNIPTSTPAGTRHRTGSTELHRMVPLRIPAFAGIWTAPDRALPGRSYLTKNNSSPTPIYTNRATSGSYGRIWNPEAATVAITAMRLPPAETAARGWKSMRTTRRCWSWTRRTRFCWETTANSSTRCVKRSANIARSLIHSKKTKSQRF